jgi:bidirectional [NiFe] hydrogenase diaphorase subunit
MDRIDLTDLAERTTAARQPVRLHGCTASGCLATGAAEVKKAMEQAVANRGLGDRVGVVGVGCLGLCGQGPLVELDPSGALFEKATAADAAALVGAAVGETPPARQLDPNHPFFASQLKIVCETSGRTNCERIDEYVAEDGYRALHLALTEMTPSEVVQAMTRSGLRGRGGAGYPTGLKWATVARMPAG